MLDFFNTEGLGVLFCWFFVCFVLFCFGMVWAVHCGKESELSPVLGEDCITPCLRTQ